MRHPETALYLAFSGVIGHTHRGVHSRIVNLLRKGLLDHCMELNMVRSNERVMFGCRTVYAD